MLAMRKMKDKDKTNSHRIIYIFGVIVIILIFASWYYTYANLVNYPCDERGTFGDMFGSINALYSGLALAGIIFTILLQRKELQYQREELRETRKEFIIQNKTLKTQRFENTFFNMLTLHNQLLNDIDFDERKSIGPGQSGYYTVRGRDVFKDRYLQLIAKFKTDSKTKNYEEIYLEFYDITKTDFGHYFRNLYRIIKMIDSTEFYNFDELNLNEKDTNHLAHYQAKNFTERYKYSSILRAQLSDYELLLLFYNCITVNGEKKFKPLIEKYHILKNINFSEIYHQGLRQYYTEKAFKL